MVNRLAEYEQAKLPAAAWSPAGDQTPQGWQDRLSSVASQANRWVLEHPEIALTAAVVTGVMLGWLIKRR